MNKESMIELQKAVAPILTDNEVSAMQRKSRIELLQATSEFNKIRAE